MTSLDMLNLDVDNGNSASLKENIEHLRDTVEQKLALVHEGTGVHTNYLIFLQQIDALLKQVSDS